MGQRRGGRKGCMGLSVLAAASLRHGRRHETVAGGVVDGDVLSTCSVRNSARRDAPEHVRSQLSHLIRGDQRRACARGVCCLCSAVFWHVGSSIGGLVACVLASAHHDGQQSECTVLCANCISRVSEIRRCVELVTDLYGAHYPNPAPPRPPREQHEDTQHRTTPPPARALGGGPQRRASSPYSRGSAIP